MNWNDIVDEAILRLCDDKINASVLDENNIVWKWVDNEMIGKRSVWTQDHRACWLEETTPANVKSWWCGGPDADYNEIFRRSK